MHHINANNTHTNTMTFFARWKARHVIPFDFSHGHAEGRPAPILTLHAPPSYSLEIQRSFTAWHFPRDDGGDEADAHNASVTVVTEMIGGGRTLPGSSQRL